MDIMKEISFTLKNEQRILDTDYIVYLNSWLKKYGEDAGKVMKSFGFFCFDLIVHGAIE